MPRCLFLLSLLFLFDNSYNMVNRYLPCHTLQYLRSNWFVCLRLIFRLSYGFQLCVMVMIKGTVLYAFWMCALQWFRYGNDISDAFFSLFVWTRKAKKKPSPSNILLCLIETIIDSNAINYIDFAWFAVIVLLFDSQQNWTSTKCRRDCRKWCFN